MFDPTSQFCRAYDKQEGARKQGDNRCDAQESKNKIENASMGCGDKPLYIKRTLRGRFKTLQSFHRSFILDS
jgi:hypothetical protein